MSRNRTESYNLQLTENFCIQFNKFDDKSIQIATGIDFRGIHLGVNRSIVLDERENIERLNKFLSNYLRKTKEGIWNN